MKFCLADFELLDGRTMGAMLAQVYEQARNFSFRHRICDFQTAHNYISTQRLSL
jgi:hypothetical protein